MRVARWLPTLDLESFASKFAQSSVRLRGSRSRRALGRCRARRIPPGDALLAIRGGRYGPKGFDALWISGDATELVGDPLEEVSPSYWRPGPRPDRRTAEHSWSPAPRGSTLLLRGNRCGTGGRCPVQSASPASRRISAVLRRTRAR